MAIDLTALEAGVRYAGDYPADLLALQKRAGAAQRALAVHGRRALVVLEGGAGANLDDVIGRMTARFEGATTRVWTISSPTPEEARDHFLRRFWARVPRAGETVILNGSWYGRVLGERVDGVVLERAWRRAYDEINEFEAQLTSDGVTLVKLWVQVADPVAERRLRQVLDDPWRRAALPQAEARRWLARAALRDAATEMLAATDTRWAPWAGVDGTSRKAARIGALGIVADRLAAAAPATPPGPSAGARQLAEALGVAWDAAPPDRAGAAG